jgi:mortality factor 4-like protein 1
VRKFNEENQELARQLFTQMKQMASKNQKSQPPKGKAVRANGSDFSSARGSEEPGRHTSVAAVGGRRRNRDYETEPVSTYFLIHYSCEG